MGIGHFELFDRITMKVPQFSPWVGRDEYDSIKSCFDINWITEGPKTSEFKDQLLKLTGAKFGVFAPNGTLAIYLGLKAMGVGSDDEVLVPDFTFIGTATAVEMAGARPVFVEVNRRNFQIDTEKASVALTKNTRAIIPVHIYGTAVNMTAVCSFARVHNLVILEDAAQGIGVYFNRKHVGTFGDTGIFSFFADKTITTGEGGMVITNDENIYKKLLYLRNQGRKDRGTFIHPEIGYNFRLTDIQSAIGLAQLKKLDEIIDKKSKILETYKNFLSPVTQIKFFEKEPNANIVPFRVGILSDSAQELMNYISSKGIEARTFFYPLHRQPCFTKYKDQQGLNDESFKNAIYGYESGICLPSFPTISTDQIEYVSSAIKAYYEQK